MQKTTYTKAIAYAKKMDYPGRALVAETGGYYVEIHEHSKFVVTSRPLPNAKAYPTPDDAELISLFQKTQGKPSKLFLAHGNIKALDALGL